MNTETTVRIWAEDALLPTYLVGEPNRNPMFLEKRVYQGSSGRVYPYPVIDKILDEKVEERHRVVFLENEYLKLMVMPGLGGRIQYAYDKTNGYPFIYHNHVIKPALVGLAGPWLSGGIEFNWPQHHRPGTYCPVDYTISENADGSRTLWLSELEPMWHLRGTLGLTLYPGKALLEISIRLFNPTPLPQSFHLWTNPAVHVNDQYQSVFPPDVQAVYDHGKRDVSAFPIARGEYYKVDYSRGVDISWYKNLPVPTSYMAAKSDYDFVGGYDHGRQSGVLHVADHHTVPGKKQWVWGCGDFGHAWDRNLTDEDGPYAELMCGVFADNQPDFSWLKPFEEKETKQFFFPYKAIGYVRNATTDAGVSLEIAGGKARLGAYATSPQPGARVALWAKRHQELNDGVLEYRSAGKRAGNRAAAETLPTHSITPSLHSTPSPLWEQRVDLGPEKPFVTEVALPAGLRPQEAQLTVCTSDGEQLVAYTPELKQAEAIPDPAKPIPEPAKVAGTEALYLAGLHLEQYRHATREPEAYYREALHRDPEDIRNNNALGRLLLRRGQFAKAEPFFRAAIKTQTRHNPNPFEGEPHYNLGLCLRYLGRVREAYDAFYKATWDAAWIDAGCFQLAQVTALRGDLPQALVFVERSLVRNAHNQKAAHLKIILLRKLGRADQALRAAEEALVRDPLDFGAKYEQVLLGKEVERPALAGLMRQNGHSYLEIAADYARAGFYGEAIDLLQCAALGSKTCASHPLTNTALAALRPNGESRSRAPGHVAEVGMPNAGPMLFYFLGYYAAQSGNQQAAASYFEQAAAQDPDRCFPNSLDSILALQAALRFNPRDARANFYLGNLWYDKRQVAEATRCWEAVVKAEPHLATAHRNLAMVYFNKQTNPAKALRALEKAFALNPADARVLFELDLLKKRAQVAPEKRFAFLEKHWPVVQEREDLLLEYITLLNGFGEHEAALNLLRGRKFHPWEGGEGKVTGQYVLSLVEMAKRILTKATLQSPKVRLKSGRGLRNARAVSSRRTVLEYAQSFAAFAPVSKPVPGDSALCTPHSALERALELLEQARSYPENLGEGKLHGAQENQVLYWLGVAHSRLGDSLSARRCWEEASHGMKTPTPAIYYNDQNPETIFYQGLAMQALGRSAAAKQRFRTLVKFGKEHLRDRVVIDYFAVSLPEFMVFDDDLDRRNQINCRYLMALGYLGWGKTAQAQKGLQKVLELDPAHLPARLHVQHLCDSVRGGGARLSPARHENKPRTASRRAGDSRALPSLTAVRGAPAARSESSGFASEQLL